MCFLTDVATSILSILLSLFIPPAYQYQTVGDSTGGSTINRNNGVVVETVPNDEDDELRDLLPYGAIVRLVLDNGLNQCDSNSNSNRERVLYLQTAGIFIGDVEWEGVESLFFLLPLPSLRMQKELQAVQ